MGQMQFPAGQRVPTKYGTTGPNYQKWGEQEHNGYVYNPETDSYYYDPKAKAKYEQDAINELTPDQPGIWEQSAASMLPTLATVGGLYGMNQLLTPDKVETLAKPLMMLQNGNVLLADGKIVNGATGAIVSPEVANSAAATTSMPTAGGGTSNGLLGIGGGSNLLTGADKTSALEGLFSGGTAAPVEGGTLIGPGTGGLLGSGEGLLGIGETGTLGQVALPIAGAGLLANTLMRDRGKTSNTIRGGLAGGLGALPFYAALGPMGLGAAVLGGGLLGLGAGGIFDRKSTKDYQKERWGEVNDPAAYALNHPENDSGVWQTGKYAGQKWSWDKALDLAKDDPTQFAGVLGNYQAGGSGWGGIEASKRDEIVQRNIAEGNYYSDKGDILVKDQDRFKQIQDEVLGS